MIDPPKFGGRVGYTRYEFNLIFGIYSRHVYTGLFRDFSFADINGQYYISFKESADKIPLVTIEKQRLGPDRALFIATTPGPRGGLSVIARSEKIQHFVDQIKETVEYWVAERAKITGQQRN
jgi:hypothetical protein